jgi:hypothetical protein
MNYSKLNKRLANKWLPLVLIGFLFLRFSITLNAQSYIGYNVDRYAGVHGVSFNPALVSGSAYRVDVNIISSSAYLSTDYLGLDIQSVLKGGAGFNFDDDLERFPSDANNFFLNTDILGPSVLFNLGQKSSVALTTRVRGAFNLSNINGKFYESIADGFIDGGDFDINMDEFAGIGHIWGEIGATYGQVLVANEKNILRGGVTLKYLAGGGGLFTNSQSLNGNYNDQNRLLTTSGNLAFGYTNGFDTGEPELAINGSGFGVDLGLVYELNPGNQEMITSFSGVENYRLRIGVSMVDIGSITYQNSNLFDYNLNGTVAAEDFEGDMSIDEILDKNYTSTERIADQKIGLPTTLSLFADYSFNQRFHVAVQGSFSLKDEISSIANGMNNSFTVTPRFETKWISIYSPVGIRGFDSSVAWGVGLRMGPLIVGSGSIVSNLISSSSKSADVYFGLKVPIYKK